MRARLLGRPVAWHGPLRRGGRGRPRGRRRDVPGTRAGRRAHGDGPGNPGRRRGGALSRHPAPRPGRAGNRCCVRSVRAGRGGCPYAGPPCSARGGPSPCPRTRSSTAASGPVRTGAPPTPPCSVSPPRVTASCGPGWTWPVPDTTCSPALSRPAATRGSPTTASSARSCCRAPASWISSWPPERRWACPGSPS